MLAITDHADEDGDTFVLNDQVPQAINDLTQAISKLRVPRNRGLCSTLSEARASDGSVTFMADMFWRPDDLKTPGSHADKLQIQCRIFPGRELPSGHLCHYDMSDQEMLATILSSAGLSPEHPLAVEQRPGKLRIPVGNSVGGDIDLGELFIREDGRTYSCVVDVSTRWAGVCACPAEGWVTQTSDAGGNAMSTTASTSTAASGEGASSV